MAKYTVLMSCGHEDTVELFGKSADRERKIEYFKTNGLCKECYKKQIEEQQAEKGFRFNATVLPDINHNNGEIQLFVWFDGNTKPYKDSIKELGGYRWTECEAAINYFSVTRPEMCWGKAIDLKDLLTETQKAESIGAESAVIEANLFSMAHYRIALEKHNAWIENAKKIASIPEPEIPEIVTGHKWNQKIYGRAGYYSIYPDGVKTQITDEQAEELSDYLKQLEDYQQQTKQIK